MKRILLVIAFIPACGIGNLPTSKHHVDFKPLASDPEQNFDSNCWLVAALSAWADKNPKSVQDSIGVDTNGDWVIYGRNRETGHVKRTELPPNPLNKDDVYNPLSKNPDWPQAFADAYDNIMGGQQAENGGSPWWLFQVFTDGYTVVDFQGDTAFSWFILQGNTMPGVMCTNQKVKSPILVASHCYSIVHSDDKNVTLRNPWGNHTFNNGYLTIDLYTALTDFQDVMYADITK